MADANTILVPSITSAQFSINPTTINGKTILEVIVAEITVVLEPEKIFSGEIYSGEV